MFWERFYQLCIGIGSKPNPVAKEIGVSSGTVTTWKNGKVPHHNTLIDIANYFDCSIDYLLGRTDIQKSIASDDLSQHEKRLIAAYRNKPNMQESIDKLLDICEPAETIADDMTSTIAAFEAAYKKKV